MQFCNEYAAAQCHRAYTCTPAAMQDADFHDEWGPSEMACSSGLAALCGTDCPTGKQVSATAKNSCLSQVNTSTCDVFEGEGYLATCGQVCSDAPATGTGGGNGGGLGGGSGGTPIADPIVFCQSFSNLSCDRAFQCVPVANRDADFTDNFGTSVTACKAMTAGTCVDPATNCPNYNASAGGSCVASLGTAACADLMLLGSFFPPLSCINACGL